MNESYLRRKLYEIIDENDYAARWRAAKTKFHSNDVFEVYDLLAVNEEGEVEYIQLTTTPNVAARRKKIKEFLKESGADINWWIAAYDKKNHCFKAWRDNRLYDKEEKLGIGDT